MALRGRVLIIVQNLPVPFDRRVWLEAKALTSAGYLVSVICPTGKDGQFNQRVETIDGITIYRYPAPPEVQSALGFIYEFAYCWLATAWLSLRVRFERGFDIIHACNPPETYFLLGAFYKLFGAKFIFDHHDLSPEMYLAKGGKQGGLLHRGLHLLEKLTFRTADVVITTNESHKEIAMQRGGIPEERIFIVRSGPDFKRLKLYPSDPDLKQGCRYLACYLGEMCPQDGVDVLLKIIHRITIEKGYQDTRYVLMGGGPSLQELRALKRDLGLDAFVEMPGRVSDEQLNRFISSADLCLDPDPYSEWADKSTMNKIMEYMAFGKPIVAFDLKEHRFSAQQAAVYAEKDNLEDFANLVVDLLADEERRKEMGEFAIERVQNELAWTYSVPHLLAAYEHVTAMQQNV